MTYPLRYPLSGVFATFGATISISVDVICDEEAGVFVATSRDIRGLVLEAESLSLLQKEVEEAIPNLLSIEHKSKPKKTSANMIYRNHLAAI